MTNQTELLEAFSRARVSAFGCMERAESLELTWHEETITDLVLAEVPPHVTVAPFTRREEARVGADWLWWWLDDVDEAFGMLVQAKRLKKGSSGHWKFGFSASDGEQQRRLVRAADYLHVPSVYALYTGTPKGRAPCLAH